MTSSKILFPEELPKADADLPNADGEDDAAGYAAMMSELPTIVSMSGLMDGDFDELNGRYPRRRNK